MTHPNHLHAAAAAWSLQAARRQLQDRARAEAEWIAAEQDAVDDGLRSTTYGSRGGGGYGDPVGDTAMAAIRPARPNRYADLALDVDRQLWALALPLPHPGPPSYRIRAAIPTLAPPVAARLTEALHRLDDVIRRRLHLAPDEWPIPGAPECPACRVRGLTAQTSAPSGQWTVICPDRCACAGPGCPCGMPVQEAGVPHIWTAQHPMVASLLGERAA